MTTQRRPNGSGHIYARARSPFLWCQYYSANGEKVRVSTGTANEEKAEKFLRRKIGEVAAGVHADTRKVSYESMRDALYADYSVNRRKSLRHDREANPVLDKVRRLDDFFGGYTAAEITTELLRKFIAREQTRGLESSTINRSLSALRRMFNLARQEGRLRNVPYFPMLKEPTPRQGFLERADYDALSRALPAYLRLPLGIAYFTAARYSEILSLRWEKVDFLENVIALDKTKNDRPRTVPISAELRALLVEQRARRQADCPFVCYKLDRKGRDVRVQSFRKAWYSACVKAGLGRFEPKLDAAGNPVLLPKRGPRSRPKEAVHYVGPIFHDLRRSGVRNLIRSGVSRDVARKISGHETDSIFSRYNITSTEDLNDAARKLDEYHKNISSGHTTVTLERNSQPVRTQ